VPQDATRSEMPGRPFKFDRNLDLRQTSRVRNMRNMFAHARRFNGNMSPWDTLDVRYFQSMFFKATSFDRDVFRVDVGQPGPAR